MNNLGKADVIVNITSGLPNIDVRKKRYNFDVSASQYPSLAKSKKLQPLLTEHVSDPQYGFNVCFPSRRKFFVDNYITKKGGVINSGSSEKPFISWSVIKEPQSKAVKDIISGWDSITVEQPDNYSNSSYLGPKWYDDPRSQEAPPSDIKLLGEWIKYVDGTEASGFASGGQSQETTSTTTTQKPSTLVTNYINQFETRDGMWWGIESSDFLNENMPFWINISRQPMPPPSQDHETFFVLSLGINNNKQRYDLYLSNQKPPMIIDYYNGGEGPYSTVEFKADLSRLLTHEKEIEIGVMTIGGKLVFIVNKDALIYHRINRSQGQDSSKLEEAKISPGKIQLYGSNIQVAINVCPMTFAPLSVMAFELPYIVDLNEKENKNVEYRGVRSDGTYGGSVAILPTEPEIKQLKCGVDCKSFSGPGGNVKPSGLGFHKQGIIAFGKGRQTNINSVSETGIYVLVMKPENTKFNSGKSSTTAIPYGGTPYFFLLKGGYKIDEAPGGISSTDITEYVLSVSESVESSDLYHIERTANLSIYNKDGKWDILKKEQMGINISWGWNGNVQKTFTGIIIGANSKESAGMETLELQCQDYMYILKNTPMVNSPFYDGMIYHFAIKDLAERAGINTIVENWNGLRDSFALKSGYAINEPLVRYKDGQSLFECIMDLIKYPEAYVYFDGDGKFLINNLPGGLLADYAYSPVADFVSDPNDEDPYKIILDERAIDISFDSTFTKVVLWTVERETLDPVIIGTTSDENILKFPKLGLIRKPELGGIEPARDWVRRYTNRVFYPIRKVSFKTAGFVMDSLKPFDFITLDGLEYRVMSFSKRYQADSNDFTVEYNAEWLGGK